MQYRRITPADDAALAALVRSNLEKHHLDIPGTAYFDPHLDHLSLFYLEDPGSRRYDVLVDAEGHVIGGIGLAAFPPIENCAELQKLYLAEGAKGNGLGYDMVRHIEDAARAMGYRSLYLETHTNLEAAIHIYEKSGYKRIDKPEGVVHSTMNRFYLKKL